MQFPKIIVISLKNSSRRAIISKRLLGLGLEFEFFDATYGKTLPQEILDSVDYEFYPKHYLSPKPLTLGEIGCAISHIRAYEHTSIRAYEHTSIL